MRTLQPGHQFRPVAVHDGQQFIIIDIAKPPPKVGFAEKPEVREQLTEPDVRG
jgi:hypothetical protein